MKKSIATRLVHNGNLNLEAENGLLVQELNTEQMYRTGMRGKLNSRRQIPLGFMSKTEIMEKYEISHREYSKIRKSENFMKLTLGTRSVYFFEPELDKFFSEKKSSEKVAE